MLNTLICTGTSHHFAVISDFFSSTVTSSLAGKNLVIGVTTGEVRSRSPLDSSPLIEEELVQSQSPGILGMRKRYLSQDYVLELSLQDKCPLRLHYRLRIFLES